MCFYIKAMLLCFLLWLFLPFVFGFLFLRTPFKAGVAFLDAPPFSLCFFFHALNPKYNTDTTPKPMPVGLIHFLFLSQNSLNPFLGASVVVSVVLASFALVFAFLALALLFSFSVLLPLVLTSSLVFCVAGTLFDSLLVSLLPLELLSLLLLLLVFELALLLVFVFTFSLALELFELFVFSVSAPVSLTAFSPSPFSYLKSLPAFLFGNKLPIDFKRVAMVAITVVAAVMAAPVATADPNPSVPSNPLTNSS